MGVETMGGKGKVQRTLLVKVVMLTAKGSRQAFREL